MLATLGLIAAGFVLGMSLAALIAFYIVGMIHAEAVRIVDSHLGLIGLAFHSDAGRPSGASATAGAVAP